MSPADRDLVIAVCRLILADLQRRPAIEPMRPTDPTYASLERRVVDLERAAPKVPKPKPSETGGVARKLYTMRDLTMLVGVTRTTLWRWEREGDFPKRSGPLVPGGRPRWSAADVDAWIAAKAAQPQPTRLDGSPLRATRQESYARRHERLLRANRARQAAKERDKR